MVAINFDWDELEDNIDEEYDDAGGTVAEYTTEPYLYGDLISQHRSGQSRFYCFDGQGSTLALTDATGNATDTTSYTAFGEITEHAVSTVNPFQYVGRKGYYRDDVVTEQIGVRMRPFGSKQGRWLNIDVAGFVDHINLYLYAHNTPTISIDPSGMKAYLDCTTVYEPNTGAPIPLGIGKGSFACHCGLIVCCEESTPACIRIDGGGEKPNPKTPSPDYDEGKSLDKMRRKGSILYEVEYLDDCCYTQVCLATAFVTIVQIPYNRFGATSNTYIHALLKACGMRFKPNQPLGGIGLPEPPFGARTGFTPPCAFGWDQVGYGTVPEPDFPGGVKRPPTPPSRPIWPRKPFWPWGKWNLW
jgi:RHS repeat-associated protein